MILLEGTQEGVDVVSLNLRFVVVVEELKTTGNKVDILFGFQDL
jgi:hypothetical protein